MRGVHRWRLEPANPMTGGFRSEVLGCTTASGAQVIIKYGSAPQAVQAEAAALHAWAGTGAAARLIDADFELQCLLLERVIPGTHLPTGNDLVAIEAAVALISSLHHVPAPAFEFPALQDYYAEAERRARDDAAYEQRSTGDPLRGQAGLLRLPAARAAALRLTATADRPVLLHGDLCAKNLLWNGSSYVAIDPLPCVGDPCADIGFFAATQPPAARILPRAAAIAGEIGYDQQRAQQWAAVWTILQTCQAWRDDQDELESCLRDAAFTDVLE